MAKDNLPKVISKANKEISTLIEQDIKKESLLLKRLVDDVLEANMEIKKRNNKRILETKRKLQELDDKIKLLNKEIEQVDRETVIEQLNQMIDSENRIFEAKNKIRFYELEQLSNQLSDISKNEYELIASVENSKQLEDNYGLLLSKVNDELFQKQLNLSDEIISLYRNLVTEKHEYVKQMVEQTKNLQTEILTIEQKLFTELTNTLYDITSIASSSTTEFTVELDEATIQERILTKYNSQKEKINRSLQQVTENYENKKQKIINTYTSFKNKIYEQLIEENKQALLKEQIAKEQKDEKLKKIRLLIIDAQRKQDLPRVQKLMKEFERLEKENIQKVTDQTERMLQQKTKKTKQKVTEQLKQLAIKHLTETEKLYLKQKLAEIEFAESKQLYLIKNHYDALSKDLVINQNKLKRIENFFEQKRKLITKLYNLKLELRIFELEVSKENELRYNLLYGEVNNLLSSLVETERKRLMTLQENVSNHDIILIKQQHQINKTAIDLKLFRDLHDIDKKILSKRNQSMIEIEKQKEKIQSEIIHQESLIKIAQKERELQVEKVRALYENERILAREQVDRIGLGIKVNDAFVKTTLENQLLFAKQQIRFAENEYQIRVENINLTRDQELAYVYQKINQFKQRYEYQKAKLQKELNEKIEDLQFKLLLFTEPKENERIKQKINEITNHYENLIGKIEQEEQKDAQIARFQEVINTTNKRAEQAILEAKNLRDNNMNTFQALLNQTEEKVAQIKDTRHSEDSANILPLLSDQAIVSAQARLNQAIKEAEVLFEERVKAPMEKIQKLKEQLLQITLDENTKHEIEQLEKRKSELIKEHSASLEELNEKQKQELDDTNDEVERAKLIQQKLLQYRYQEISTTSLSRTQSNIEEEYKEIKNREATRYKEVLSEVNRMINIQLEEHTKVLRDTNKWIKSAMKSYRKFIRHSSKDLNLEKKNIIKTHHKETMKNLNELKSTFKIEL